MPRFARLHAPGTVQHLIARCVNGEFRLRGAHERFEYLRRLGETLARADWRLLAFALMSNHVHLVAIAGATAPARLMRALQTGFAVWLNKAHGRLGPVFAERYSSSVFGPGDVPRLLAYVHNNPVRAHVVGDARDTDWTSHRAYVGLDEPPAWLAVADGLEAARCRDGRDFHDLVLARAHEQRDPALGGRPLRLRSELRRQLRAPVEVTSPLVDEQHQSVVILTRTELASTAPWSGPAHEVLARVAAERRWPLEHLSSRLRSAELAAARRVCAAAWLLLERPMVELAEALRVSGAAVSQLVRACTEADVSEARVLVAVLRGE